MRNKLIFYIFILVLSIVIIHPIGLVWAKAPSIHIDLSFNKRFYEYRQPIGVAVTLTNESEEDLLISKGFGSMAYYMRMRLIDPANKLLLARQPDAYHDEFPDAPPVPFVMHKERFIRAVSCEVLPKNWRQRSQTSDILDFYDMKLPGYYSAQVQISAMVFKGDPCDVQDFNWLGILKSETRYFYYEGATEVYISPGQWDKRWQNQKDRSPKVEVEIWPEEGKTAGDYQLESIKLNNVEAEKVLKVYSSKREKQYLQALFNATEAIRSLGDIDIGKTYSVRVSGKMTSGEYFGGSRQITIMPYVKNLKVINN